MLDLRKTAIYSRKSKFTGKGESIESQVDMCKTYLKVHFPDVTAEDILIYEDEGYSGGNTNRPKFQEMLKECKRNGICRIICYKLDRISRSISDFIKLTEDLNLHDVEFVSISDNYETHTATGRAMLTMTMVFAQLERETIAERIRDNMMYLARDGRWLGGNPPTGYKSTEAVARITVDGKKRSARMLEIVEEEAMHVRTIFSKYLELKSLTKVETYLIQNNIKTKTGIDFTRFAIKTILQNPVYLIADEQAWNYFATADVEIYSSKEKFDSIHGMMVYNKTNQQKKGINIFNSINEWVIAIGKHKGLICGADWVQAQKMLEQNKSKSFRKPKSNVALLSGLLFCEHCGSFMRPKLSQRKNQDGELIYDYLCELKEKSKGQKCNASRVRGNELDKEVCKAVETLREDPSEFMKQMQRGMRSIDYNNEAYQENLKFLRKTKSKYEKQIHVLLETLKQSEGTAANDYILNEINQIDELIKSIEKQIQECLAIANTNTTPETEFEIMAEMMSNTNNVFDKMSIEQKRNTLRSIIHRITTDGENFHILFFGVEEGDIDLTTDEISEAVSIGLQMRS